MGELLLSECVSCRSLCTFVTLGWKPLCIVQCLKSLHRLHCTARLRAHVSMPCGYGLLVHWGYHWAKLL